MPAQRQLLHSWHDDRTLFYQFDRFIVALHALTDDMIRVRVGQDGSFAPRRSWSVTPADEAFAPVEVEFSDVDGVPAMLTGKIAISLESSGDHLVFRERASGRLLLEEAAADYEFNEDGSQRSTKSMPVDDGLSVFGLGERTGLLAKDPRVYTCWNTDRYEDQSPNTDELYLSVPFMLTLNPSGQSLGLFLENTYRSQFDLSAIASGRISIGVQGGALDYCLIYGPDPANVVQRLADLTGRAPLPPRWALGYHQARWSYESADDVRAIADEFRTRAIPLDAIYLDIDATDGYRVFTWNRECFPDPKGLADDLNARGIRLVNIVNAGVKEDQSGDYSVFNDGLERDCYLRTGRGQDAPLFLGYVWPGLCAFPDFAREDVRAWWGDQYRTLVESGMSGFVNDMNEPALHDKPFDDPASFRTEPPLDLPHGSADEPATHAEIHNLYGSLEAEATHDGLVRLYPNRRPFVLSRAGFAGIQQFAGTWTGDNWSTWEHLEMSLPQLLNLGLSGIPFAGADIGGFFENCEAELLCRWMQLGAFYPIARNNSARGTARQEPWSFGEEATDICRSALELRYRLLPYLYSVCEETTRTGLPVLRPLFLSYPGDKATHRIHDQALVGRDLLIAPIVRPGKSARSVYLPPGVWFEAGSGAWHSGPANVLAAAPPDAEIPHFCRGGSIIPSGPPMQWIDERPLKHLRLDVYPDASGYADGDLYEDDGWSLNYQNGERRTTHFTFQPDGRVLTASATGSFLSTIEMATVCIHEPNGVRDVTASVSGDAWKVEF